MPMCSRREWLVGEAEAVMAILPYAVGTAEVGERSAAATGVAECVGDHNEPP